MTYILLRDTFGGGLETISNIGVNVIEEHRLEEYICAAAEITLDEDGWDSVEAYDKENIPMNETLVICKIVETIKDKSVEDYIQDVLNPQENRKNEEEYQLYLKLKEKFGDT